MDYSLAALKVLSAQLKDAREAPSQNALTLGGILFQRAWLQVLFFISPLLVPFFFFYFPVISPSAQGVLLSAAGGDDSRLLLDDGTGIVELGLAGEFRLRQWNSGMYVMVVGGYLVRTSDIPIIKVHKIVDLSSFPDREAMWYLEVLEAYKLFYKPLIEDFI